MMWCSPRARTGRRNSAGWSAARAERRGRAALAEEDDAGASVLLVTVGQLVEILRRSYGG
jgi:hypothetical protein